MEAMGKLPHRFPIAVSVHTSVAHEHDVGELLWCESYTDTH
jgi:hypothetical protein